MALSSELGTSAEQILTLIFFVSSCVLSTASNSALTVSSLPRMAATCNGVCSCVWQLHVLVQSCQTLTKSSWSNVLTQMKQSETVPNMQHVFMWQMPLGILIMYTEAQFEFQSKTWHLICAASSQNTVTQDHRLTKCNCTALQIGGLHEAY